MTLPDRPLVQRLVAVVVARRRPPGLPERHPRPGQRRLHRRRRPAASCAPIGGEATMLARDPAWSPDGRTLAFCGGGGDYEAIGVYDVERELVTWAWGGEGNAHSPSWSPDGAPSCSWSTTGPRARSGISTSRPGFAGCLDLGSGNHYHARLHPRRRRRRLRAERPRAAPPTCSCIELASGAVTRLTDSLPDDLAGPRVRVGSAGRAGRSRDRLTDVPGLFCEPPRPQRRRRRHHPRRPDLAPQQRMGPGAPGPARRRLPGGPPQLPRQRRLHAALAARQPLPARPGRGAGLRRAPSTSSWSRAATRAASP